MRQLAKLLSTLTVPLALSAMPVLTSCGSEHEDTLSSPLATPQYESVSGKYIVTDFKLFQSIELGASGDFIIVTDNDGDIVQSPHAVLTDTTRAHRKKSTGRIDENDLVSGKYTVLSDGSFQLEDVGKLTISGGNGNTVKLALTGSYGTYNMTAEKATKTISSNAFTDALCRSWHLESVREITYEDGQLVSDTTYSNDQLQSVKKTRAKQIMTGIMFSKFGTAAIYFTGIGISRYGEWLPANIDGLRGTVLIDYGSGFSELGIFSFSYNQLQIKYVQEDEMSRTETYLNLEEKK